MEQAPPAAGEKFILTIDDIAFGGEGVGRCGEFVVFVPFTALGEKVEVELTEVRQRFGRAKLLRVVEASPARVEPQCPYYTNCGGCQYQHLAYEEQLRVKHKQISDLFRRIGRFEGAEIDPVVPCPSPFGYRNRIMIRSQWDKFKQGLNIGYIRADNRLVVDITRCDIAEPALNEQILRVRENPPPKGGIKVVLRVAPEGWALPRDSFFQNNFHLLPRLVETVQERVRDGGCKYLIDAYCGVGFFSVQLANLVERYVGVEVDTAAIAAARQNALSWKAANGEFVAGRTEELLDSLVDRFPPRETALILDPPRTGCPGPMLDALKANVLGQILYVSCHPATLARDLNLLCADGAYSLKKITPLDMFPQTQHVECVADLRPGNPPT